MKFSRRTVVKTAMAYGSLLVSGAGCASVQGAAANLGEGKAGVPMKLLILGGTVFLGPELVQAATARGHTLTLFNRGKTNPHLFPEVEKLHGDRDGDLKALEGRKWDAVIDTSGYVPRVVRASAELLAPSVQQYVFISSISVYPDNAKPGTDEHAPVQTLSDEKNEEVRQNYGALKALCEKAAEAVMPGRVTNVRPGLIVGPGDPSDRFTYWPVRVARGGEVLAPGTGKDPVQFVDVRDLAEWIIHCVERRHVGVYNATGPDRRLSIAELLGACQTAGGGEATFTWADAAFLEQQKVVPWSDLPVWTGGEDFATISNAKAIDHGLRFRPLEGTVRDTLAWFRTLPAERQAKLRSGLTSERELAVLAEWKKQRRAAG